jgi:glycosyltransferase involved in cell wall biosynthesis
MKISIIIPAFNEEKLIGRTLTAVDLAAKVFATRGWSCEMIVCDNNSTDRTSEIASAAGAKVVFEPMNQISRARNKGASAATGEWFIFIDADSIPSPELFDRVAENILSGECLGGGCLVELDEHRPIGSVVVSAWNFVSRTLRYAAGSFIYCDAETFRELNGFSTRLYASEEIEFSRRLKRLASRRKRRVMIITEAKLTTSARKMDLYSKREYARFVLKAFFLPWKVLTNRDECAPWYDGRR